ncbi:MAG: phosphatase PAP2 family protein [Verrucomicrobia bacterium]|nr:phosphatase PAP2 family protein [Verrucomicrobiota bacterium]
MSPHLAEVRDDLRSLFRHAGHVARRYAVTLGLIAAAVAAFVILVWPSDPWFSRAMYDRTTGEIRNAARVVRRWGSFTDTLVICGGLYAAGRLCRRRGWRVAALAAFTAACVGGLTVNALRFTTGRPRPRAGLANAMHGPSLRFNMQSFPSGHAATSIGCGIALATALPPLALPALLNAGAVATSSLPIRSHYLTDVVAGGTIGTCAGLVFGAAARRRLRELRVLDPHLQ